MSDREAPRLNKIPFIAGDILLVVVAGVIVFQAAKPMDLARSGLVVACGALGAWFCLLGYLTEYRARLQFAEADELARTVDQLKALQSVADQIALATSQWQTVQEHSGKTVQSAREITERMTTEARTFGQFLEQANDQEKKHLRLEVEKLRRAEAEWLQIVVRLMDNVFALHTAGARSGQPHLIEQFTMFQNACRDIIRRAGLVPIVPAPETPFDEKLHVVMEGRTAQPGDQIGEVLACGYSFQGQMVRPPLVALRAATAPAPDATQPPSEVSPALPSSAS